MIEEACLFPRQNVAVDGPFLRIGNQVAFWPLKRPVNAAKRGRSSADAATQSIITEHRASISCNTAAHFGYGLWLYSRTSTESVPYLQHAVERGFNSSISYAYSLARRNLPETWTNRANPCHCGPVTPLRSTCSHVMLPHWRARPGCDSETVFSRPFHWTLAQPAAGGS